MENDGPWQRHSINQRQGKKQKNRRKNQRKGGEKHFERYLGQEHCSNFSALTHSWEHY